MVQSEHREMTNSSQALSSFVHRDSSRPYSNLPCEQSDIKLQRKIIIDEEKQGVGGGGSRMSSKSQVLVPLRVHQTVTRRVPLRLEVVRCLNHTCDHTIAHVQTFPPDGVGQLGDLFCPDISEILLQCRISESWGDAPSRSLPLFLAAPSRRGIHRLCQPGLHSMGEWDLISNTLPATFARPWVASRVDPSADTELRHCKDDSKGM